MVQHHPADARHRGHAFELGDRVVDGRTGQDGEAEEPIGILDGELLREPVVVPARERDVGLVGDRGDVEGALPGHRGEQQLGVDAVGVHLGEALFRVARADEAVGVGEPRRLEVLPPAPGREVQAERHGLRLAGHQPRVAAAGELHDLRDVLAELGVDEGLPQVRRHLEVGIGRHDLVVAHENPLAPRRDTPTW